MNAGEIKLVLFWEDIFFYIFVCEFHVLIRDCLNLGFG